MHARRAVTLVALLAPLAVAGPTRAGQPESEAGLKAVIEELLAAGKAGDATRVEALARGMVLPDHEAWFRRVFGPGARSAASTSTRSSTRAVRSASSARCGRSSSR
ncbi:MAG: hypothetical protein HY906_10905 [Deltaproteobacteria bacterium]|nr:hypothetical protein [Deltaproteobacteria bacterium]